MVHEQADDSHTNLYFDPLSQRILGCWFSDDQDQQRIMSLHLSSLKLECLDAGFQFITSIKSNSRTIAKVEEKLSKQLLDKGILSHSLPEKMP